MELEYWKQQAHTIAYRNKELKLEIAQLKSKIPYVLEKSMLVVDRDK